jgi:hypothetical protein
MARHRSRKADGLSPLLVRLIKAAKHSGRDAEGADIAGVPHALREFGALALWAIPVYGVFVPNRDEIAVAVARVARAHLGLDEARKELRDALKAIERFDQRDPIESALNHVLSVSDATHFYAGLAFGLTLADLP